MKKKKTYNDSKVDDAIDGRRTFDVEEKLHDVKFNQNLSDVLLELEGKGMACNFYLLDTKLSPYCFKIAM